MNSQYSTNRTRVLAKANTPVKILLIEKDQSKSAIGAQGTAAIYTSEGVWAALRKVSIGPLVAELNWLYRSISSEGTWRVARDVDATAIRVRLSTLLIWASGRIPFCARRLAVLRNSLSIVLMTCLTVRTLRLAFVLI